MLAWGRGGGLNLESPVVSQCVFGLSDWCGCSLRWDLRNGGKEGRREGERGRVYTMAGEYWEWAGKRAHVLSSPLQVHHSERIQPMLSHHKTRRTVIIIIPTNYYIPLSGSLFPSSSSSSSPMASSLPSSLPSSVLSPFTPSLSTLSPSSQRRWGKLWLMKTP